MSAAKRTYVCPADHMHARRSICYRAHGCSCTGCRVRESKRKRDERERRRNGTQKGMVSPDRVVAHVRRLIDGGMYQTEIADRSGVNVATVRRLYRGEDVQAVFSATERALLAIEFSTVTRRNPAALVAPTGTVRRLQALMAIGHTGAEISSAVGRNDEWAARVLRGACSWEGVTETTRAAVARAYDQLWDVTPEGSYAIRARRWAARRGYAPPLAWDDDTIDDPDASPHLDAVLAPEEKVPLAERCEQANIDAAIAGETVDLAPLERREVVRRLWSVRWSDRRIAGYAQCSTRHVVRIRDELDLPGWELYEMETAA